MTKSAENLSKASRRVERSILGLDFYRGDAREAVAQVSRYGGLVVAPAAPALKAISTHLAYRDAMLHADLILPDSAFMVVLWRVLEGQKLPRTSGVGYLRELLTDDEFRRPGNSFWVMPGEKSARKHLHFLEKSGVAVPSDCVYLAPRYGEAGEDRSLLDRLREKHTKHVVIAIGGGKQEPLGCYLKLNLGYQAAIHCIGAAIGLLSGEQVRIPRWADKSYLGWLFRCASNPVRYVPRYLSALGLAALLARYRDELPPLEGPAPKRTISFDGDSSSLQRVC